MNAIQQFLQAGGTIEQLKTDYALDIKRHPDHTSLLNFKYDQIFSRPEDHPIVRAARGLILDEADNWKIINRPFERFFNYGQHCADAIDLTNADILTKLDGSLLCLWNYNGTWLCSTTGSPGANGDVGDWKFSFNELFWSTFNDLKLPMPTNPILCYMFELTSIYNKVVVRYGDSALTLVGVRNRITGEELLPEDFPQYPQVKSYEFNNADAMVEYLKGIPAIEMEGFVVRSKTRLENGNFARIKIKSEQYVRHHHIKSSWSQKNALSIVLANEQAEIKTYFPEYTQSLDDIEKRLDWLVKDLEATYAEISGIEDQKAYALALQKRKPIIPGALYMLKRGKVESVKKYLAEKMIIRNLMDVMGLRDREPGEEKYEAKNMKYETDEDEALPEIVFDDEPAMGN
jgi:hypothetical protein